MAKRSREDLKLEDQDYDSDTSINTVDTSASLPSAPKSKRFDPNSDDDFDCVVIRCSLPGHLQNLPFHCIESYETHYTRMHINRCAECRAVLPSAHMLSLHQREYHDPFFAILKDKNEQAEKGGKKPDPPIQPGQPDQPRPSHLLPPQPNHKLQPTQCCQPPPLSQPSEKPDKERIYACFDHMCDKMCSSARKRKMHLIDKHGYPKDYEFRIVDWGIEGRSTLLREPKERARGAGGRRRSLTLEKKTEDARGKEKYGEDGEAMDVDVDVKYPAPQAALPAIREAAKAQLAAVAKATMPATDKQPGAPVEAKGSENAMDVDELAGAMSALRFVPTSVRLGKARARPRKD